MNQTKVFTTFIAVSALSLALAQQAQADVRLPGIFSDHMVLQQGARTAVWGWADEGEVVTVQFRNQKARVTARNGQWRVSLKNLKAGGPDTLTVLGHNTLSLRDVLVGEVWVCSGQSNMEFIMKGSYQSQSDIENSATPNIRLFTVPKLKANAPTNDIPSSWQECNAQTVAGFSAVGYYFGRDLQKARGVPVGLIHTSWGGSPAEVWMSEEALAKNPEYKKDILDVYPAQYAQYQQDLAKWQQETAALEKEGKKQTRWQPWPTWKPTELYNGMLAPLMPYTIKGAIWYQGESNAGRAWQYRTLYADMIRNWRQDWHSGDFTFLCVQLAPFMKIQSAPGESDWAELREAQFLSTKVVPKAGMAVITDVGDEDNIHPTKKEPVGARLALAARGIAYREPVVFSGPEYKSMKVKGSEAILGFSSVGSGLEARGGELKGFAICGADRKFVWANARIEGNKVVVSSPEVPTPVAVRFGWANYPVVNLWNKEGLPATPFRTDDFPMITAPKK